MALKPLIQVFWEGLWSAGRWSVDRVMLVFSVFPSIQKLASYVRVGTAEGLVCMSRYSERLMVSVK